MPRVASKALTFAAVGFNKLWDENGFALEAKNALYAAGSAFA